MRPSNETRVALNAYCRTMADELGLRDWTLIVNYDTPTIAEENARVDVTYGRRVVTISWGETFWTETRAEQRQTVVHELMHIHLDAISAVSRSLAEQLGSFAYSVFSDNEHLQVELATDAIAEAIAHHFPLPPRLRLE